MKLKNLMIFNAFVCLVIGIPLLLFPSELATVFGLNLNPGGTLIARLFGGSILGNVLITWFCRNDTGSISLFAAVLYLFVYHGINFFVCLWATIAGIVGIIGLTVVVIYLFFTLSYGYVLFSKKEVI